MICEALHEQHNYESCNAKGAMSVIFKIVYQINNPLTFYFFKPQFENHIDTFKTIISINSFNILVV